MYTVEFSKLAGVGGSWRVSEKWKIAFQSGQVRGSLSSGVCFQGGNDSLCCSWTLFSREGETEDCEPQQVAAEIPDPLLSDS